MSEDDSEQVESNESGEISVPTRGTASRGNPLSGSAPEEQSNNSIVIRDPRGDVRVYEMNDNMRAELRKPIEASLDKYADWYETWWNGTVLMVEFEGQVRTANKKSPPGQNQQSMPQYPQEPWVPRNRTPQAVIDIDDLAQQSDKDYGSGSADKMMFPVYDFVELDMQDKADRNPLGFEDKLILIGEEPVENVETTDAEDTAPDIDDIREMTDGEETVAEGARGRRYNL